MFQLILMPELYHLFFAYTRFAWWFVCSCFWSVYRSCIKTIQSFLFIWLVDNLLRLMETIKVTYALEIGFFFVELWQVLSSSPRGQLANLFLQRRCVLGSSNLPVRDGCFQLNGQFMSSSHWWRRCSLRSTAPTSHMWISILLLFGLISILLLFGLKVRWR